jgi:hypothetical protein
MSSSPLKNAAILLMLLFLVGAGYQKAIDFDVFEMGSHPKIGELILLWRQDDVSFYWHLPFKDRLSQSYEKSTPGSAGLSNWITNC